MTISRRIFTHRSGRRRRAVVALSRSVASRRHRPRSRPQTPVMGPSLLNADQLTLLVPLARLRARPSARAQQRRARARADLHQRRRARRRARRHGVRAGRARDGRLLLLRQRPDPARVQQLRRHQRERRSSEGHDVRRGGARPAARVALLPDAADRRARRTSTCCAATRIRSRASCPTACGCHPPTASGSPRSGSTSAATARRASSSGRRRPTTACASSSSTRARSS